MKDSRLFDLDKYYLNSSTCAVYNQFDIRLLLIMNAKRMSNAESFRDYVDSVTDTPLDTESVRGTSVTEHYRYDIWHRLDGREGCEIRFACVYPRSRDKLMRRKTVAPTDECCITVFIRNKFSFNHLFIAYSARANLTSRHWTSKLVQTL